LIGRRSQQAATARKGLDGRNLGLAVALALALTALAVFSPKYMAWENFVVVALQMAFIGIAALGTTHLVIGGSIDLSIGSLFALTAVCAALIAKVAPPTVAFLGAMAVGSLIGFLNGALVWRVRLSPIIITLGSLAILRGVVLLVTGGYSVRGVPVEFGAVGQTRLLGLPLPVCALLALAAVSHSVLSYTTLGRHLFAVGGNRAACEAAGIPVRRLVLGSFLANGAIVGLSGALAASRFGSASPAFGTAMELDVITAVILGGGAFTGGEGNVLGVLLAVALLGVINSGIVSLGIDPHYAEVVKGVTLIAAVTLDQLSHEARERYRKLYAAQER
jgi:ribose/xylose/arabinose/galactoside ABC-type transport system permease subunit